MDPDSSARRNAIEKTLLDYHRTPGQYALIGRQPALLFSSVKEVLQLASGRAPSGDEADPPAEPVRLAACFFIRSALLYPNADHYALLGLDRGTDAAAVKDRYRLMMRLMHPDFANALSSVSWPADAATRVNRAYEVLSSPEQRRDYDEQIDSPAAHRTAHADARPASRVPPVMKGAETKPVAEDPRRRLKRLATVFGAVGGLALLGALFANGQADKETLVQRSASPEPPQAAPVAAPIVVAALPKPAEPPAPAPEPVAAAPEPEPVAAAPAPAPAVSPPPPPPPSMPVEPQRVAPAPLVAPPPPVAARAPAVVLPPPVAKTPVAPVLPPPVAAPPVQVAAAPVVLPPPAPTKAPAVVAAPVVPAPVAPPAVQAAAPTAPPPPPPPAPAPAAPVFTQVVSTPPLFRLPQATAPTMAEVHPLLSRLLQQLESGWGDRVVNLLDRDARNSPSAQALLQQYNGVVDGMRPVKLSNAQFRAEPRDGRLLVIGRIQIQGRDAVAPRELAVQAEFAARDGAVVMTRLAPVRD